VAKQVTHLTHGRGYGPILGVDVKVSPSVESIIMPMLYYPFRCHYLLFKDNNDIMKLRLMSLSHRTKGVSYRPFYSVSQCLYMYPYLSVRLHQIIFK
jgi:hypothetical protein